jgi:predicted amidophosphoribosyltransferase
VFHAAKLRKTKLTYDKRNVFEVLYSCEKCNSKVGALHNFCWNCGAEFKETKDA